MKSKIIETLAFISYWLGIDALFYWFNRKSKRILTFHNVLPDSMFRDGVANGVSNRLSDFISIIEESAKKFHFSTDLFDAKTLTITFDDGYRNQYTTAFTALQKHGIQAYLFVSGDVDGGGGLVIDKLLHWVAEAPIEYIPDGDRLRYWVHEIWPRFVADVSNKGNGVLARLCEKFPYENIVNDLPSDYVRERLTGITNSELDEMRKAGWKIGWHTKSHYPLARLSEAELRKEFDSPIEFRNVCLSYPYGNPVEVGKNAIRIAEEFGYPCAVSNTSEVDASRFFLPRMSVSPDKYRLHFQLSGLEYFIKNLRLLPVIDVNGVEVKAP